MNYFLIKSEGDCYGIDDLKSDKKVAWEGVRNYQARNYMMRDMKVGDKVLFYHSNGTKENPTGVYGVAQVSSPAHVDESQFDKKDEHYDPKSKKEKPLWYCVDFKFVAKFKNPVSLFEMKLDPKLKGMRVLERGSRLSITPVSEVHFLHVVKLGE